jgi:hypothetical protein
MGAILSIGIFALIISAIAAYMKCQNDKLNRPSFKRGCIVANKKTRMLAIVQSVDHTNRVLHTSDGGQHFSHVELVEVGDYLEVINKDKFVRVIAFNGPMITTEEGAFNYMEVMR